MQKDVIHVLLRLKKQYLDKILVKKSKVCFTESYIFGQIKTENNLRLQEIILISVFCALKRA